MERLDIFPKTFDDFKERTLGGALISIVCCLLALCLFTAEFAQYRAVETVDRLDVDTRTLANSKLSINLDVVLPSLPCDEIVMDVVDESGSEQLAVTNTLHKLRIDRHGVPIDTPEVVDWSHTLAPAFHQRKVIQLMDDAHLQLAETLGHLEHEEEENPGLSAEEHAAHREELTTQAALLQGRLAHLTAVAEAADHTEVVGDAAHQEHLAMTAQEVEALHASVAESQAYSDEQREQVLSNLHAMSRNLDRLQSMGPNDAKTAGNLREALRIRLSILQDNVAGFVSAADIDRRDNLAPSPGDAWPGGLERLRRIQRRLTQRLAPPPPRGRSPRRARYSQVEEILNDVLNATGSLERGMGAHLNESVRAVMADLGELSEGARGARRAEVETRLSAHLAMLQADLRGEEVTPEGYCGSCYGASLDPSACCNTCDDLRAAYRQRKWGFPSESSFDQCRRDKQRRAQRREEGEGCNVYGTMQVARVTGSFHIAPASKATGSQLGALLVPHRLQPDEVGHFNVSHHIRRLSFGTDFPGQTNPLDAASTYSPSGAAISRYFLKVVPTTYEFLSGEVVHTNQFSVTSYFKPIDIDHTKFVPPTITFTFELTPIKVRKTERRGGSLLGFFTRCAALIGGLFTVAGIVDASLYHSSKKLRKMAEGRQD